MENFKIYRRHDKDCPLFGEGMKSDIKKCTCPLWVDGSENGKRIRKSLKTRSVSRGLERLVRMQREQVGDGTKAVPVDEAVKLYLGSCRERKLANETLRQYTSRLNPLVTFSPKALVRSITPDSLADFRTAHPSGPAPASARSQILVLKAFFKFCQGRKWCTENPADMKLPKLVWKLTPPYTDDEVERLLAACDQLKSPGNNGDHSNRQRARALLLLLLYSGLRISDAVQLRRDAVDFNNGKVLLRVMKTGGPLYANLPTIALDALRAVKRKDSPYFFWTGRGDVRSAIWGVGATIRAVGKYANVPGARPHRFRDTFAVALLLNGVDIRTVQMLLGHSSVVTTERHYAPYVAGMQLIVNTAVSTLHFGTASRAPAVVDTLGDARGNTKRDPRSPLPFPLRRRKSA